MTSDGWTLENSQCYTCVKVGPLKNYHALHPFILSNIYLLTTGNILVAQVQINRKFDFRWMGVLLEMSPVALQSVTGQFFSVW